MQKTAPAENKMGVMPIPKLIINMSLPMIASMLVQALYNIVDSVFVAMYDNVAGTAALTLAFPMQNLMIAVAVGLSVGMNALLSRATMRGAGRDQLVTFYTSLYHLFLQPNDIADAD